jgi:hypothetical protein
MAIQVSGTEVISNARALNNIASMWMLLPLHLLLLVVLGVLGYWGYDLYYFKLSYES